MNGGLTGRWGKVRRIGKTGGFTIVETLIVLAITMAMFLSATLLINGKQRTTAFNQSIRAIQTELQQTIDTVSSGYYGNDGSVTCSLSAGAPLVAGGGSDAQGTNQPCVYLGKVLQFHVGNSTDPQQYYAYTLVGIRDPISALGFDLTASKARVIPRATAPSTVDIKNLQYGLTPVKMTYAGGPISAVGFASNTGEQAQDDNSQRVNIFAIPGSGDVTNQVSDDDSVSHINSVVGSLPAAAINPPAGISICFASGGTDQSGLITLGGNGQSSGVQLKIYANGTCT